MPGLFTYPAIPRSNRTTVSSTRSALNGWPINAEYDAIAMNWSAIAAASTSARTSPSTRPRDTRSATHSRIGAASRSFSTKPNSGSAAVTSISARASTTPSGRASPSDIAENHARRSAPRSAVMGTDTSAPGSAPSSSASPRIAAFDGHHR